MKWDDKHELGFPLLSDPDHKVAAKYGVWGPKKLYGKEYEGIIRSMFWISNNGRILECWYKISPKVSVEKSTEVLERSNEQIA
jgi:peroxiredoxin Q/BCP